MLLQMAAILNFKVILCKKVNKKMDSAGISKKMFKIQNQYLFSFSGKHIHFSFHILSMWALGYNIFTLFIPIFCLGTRFKLCVCYEMLIA